MNNNLSGQQFGHLWKKTRNEFDQKVYVSETPHGKYTINGNGYGRMKWSVHHGEEGSGWEALGTTLGEVKAEADRDLRDRQKRAGNE